MFRSSQVTRSRVTTLVVAAALSLSLSACVKKSSGEGGGSSPAADQNAKRPFPPGATLTQPPIPAPGVANPLVGAKLFVDPQSLAMLQYNRLKTTDPTKGALLEKIALQPQGLWMGGWNSDIFRAVEYFVKRAVSEGSVPVMIAYNIPLRDCGQYSAGGLKTPEEYMRWIRNVAAGIGNDPAVVILEPDAIPHFQECLTEEQKNDRMAILNDAVRVLRALPKTAVYLDAGHARWVTDTNEIARRLKLAGVEYANGFSLNVSNYVSTEENLEYGKKVSAALGGKHFIIDTSRNGAGPYEEAKTEEEKWCNPPGRKIGANPTTMTGEPLCDGFLWLKRPGESDGECRGGPKAGVWWEPQALELAR